MGMFDSFKDADENEWQTKAFGCNLSTWRIGDTVVPPLPDKYQVEVLGDSTGYKYATIENGVLVEVPSERDNSLPLMDYIGTI